MNEIRDRSGDLLGRDPVQPDQELLGAAYAADGDDDEDDVHQCRAVPPDTGVRPHTLVLFEQCEYNLYNIQSDLEERCGDGLSVRIVPILNPCATNIGCSTMSAERHTVYHAAACKHVPMVECNVAGGILNNVFGTLHCAQAALRAGVQFRADFHRQGRTPTNTMGCANSWPN